MSDKPIEVGKNTKWPECERKRTERDKLLDVLLAIVNTAQDNPDRCMADVCNDNFIAHNLPLTAVMTGSEYNRIKIINTSNEQADARESASVASSALLGAESSQKQRKE